MTPQELAQRVGEKLTHPPNNILFTLYFIEGGSQRSRTLYHRDFHHHSTITSLLTSWNSYSHNYHNEIHYQLLDFPLEAIENHKLIKIYWQNPKAQIIQTYFLLLPLHATVHDLHEKLRATVSLEGTRQIRLMEVELHRIVRIVDSNFHLDDSHKFVAEEIPQEDIDKRPEDKLINCFHFTYESFSRGNPFGNPFLCLARRGDTLANFKEKVKHKLGVSEADFNKWKFICIPSLRDLRDEDVLSDQWDSFNSLGMNHPDNTPRFRRTEQAIKFKNQETAPPSTTHPS